MSSRRLSWLVVAVGCLLAPGRAIADDLPPPPPLELDELGPMDPGDALVDDAPSSEPSEPPVEPFVEPSWEDEEPEEAPPAGDPPPLPEPVGRGETRGAPEREVVPDVERDVWAPADSAFPEGGVPERGAPPRGAPARAPTVGWGAVGGAAIGCLGGACVAAGLGCAPVALGGPVLWSTAFCAAPLLGSCFSGPLLGCGSTAGTGIGALLEEGDVWTGLAYATPGLALGLLGFGLTAAGVGLAYWAGSGTVGYAIPLASLGALVQLAAGPVTIAGVSLGAALSNANPPRAQRRLAQTLALPEPAPSLAVAY